MWNWKIKEFQGLWRKSIIFLLVLITSSKTSKLSDHSVLSMSSIKTYPVYEKPTSTPEHQRLPHHYHQENQQSPLISDKPIAKNSVPSIMKIFENPSPDDGFESLRKFSDGMKDGMFQTQLYNTSIALTSALFSFQLPSNSNSEETTISMANQTIFGMFAFLSSVLIFALPVLLTGQKFNPEARNNDEGIISRILKTEPLARLIESGTPEKIGLEPEKCLQKTICEAHRFPNNKKYGMLALPFQIFYPPPSNNRAQSQVTSFQEAAYIGKYETARCGKKYNCFFDVLDLERYLLDWYQYHRIGQV